MGFMAIDPVRSGIAVRGFTPPPLVRPLTPAPAAGAPEPSWPLSLLEMALRSGLGLARAIPLEAEDARLADAGRALPTDVGLWEPA